MIDEDRKTEKVVIIGGGPAGLAAALYAARGNLSPLLIVGSPPGGQLILTSEVENYPGFESILGAELIKNMTKHAQKFGTRIINENVIGVDFSRKPFKIHVSNEDIVVARSVIIATGAKALWLGLESEKRLRGHGVSACATCDGFFFKGKVVGVVGGGDAAMEEAMILSSFASKIYMFHRRDSFRASKIMQERVFSNPKIEIIWNTEVVEILGKEKVEGVRLKQLNQSESVKSVGVSHSQFNQSKPIQPNTDLTDLTLELDGLFVAIGHKPDTNLFEGKLELDKKGYIITANRFASELARSQIQNHNVQHKVTLENKQLEEIKQKFDLNYNYITSILGVFAAGDCVDFQYRQASTAVGMGVAAALEVENFLE